MIYRLLAFQLGFTCFIVQLVMLREFLSLFMGNELVIAIILGLWMLLTAAGAWIGQWMSASIEASRPIFSMLLICGASPLLGIYLTFWLRSQLYAPGALISLQGSILLSLTGLTIFCLASGIMFTLLATSLSGTEGRRGIARIYAVEALGSLAGGLVFNFVLIYTFNSIHILILLLGFSIGAVTIYALMLKRTFHTAFGLLSLIIVIAGSFMIDMEQTAFSMIFPGREVIMSKDTPFGKLVAIEQSGQSDIYLSGQVLASSGDIIGREEKVHYAMCLHKDPGHVLMLSGGLDGSPAEVIKYQPAVLDYVDQDPWSIEYADELQISEWPAGICIYKTDPQVFLQTTFENYDVILYNGPAPNSIGNNRHYTREFYHKLKMHLNPGGIFSTSLPDAGNYMSDEMKMLFSSIHATLKSEFEYIRIIPGNRTYILASDTPLDGIITERISELGILTEYVNLFYLDDKLIADRAEWITEQLDENANINLGTRPLAAHLSVLEWLGLQQLPVLPIILTPLILMGIVLLMMSRYNIGLFATGFTASSGEFLLLIAFQAVFGFIYQMAGLIIMIFMAGLFAGAGFLFRFFSETKRSFIAIQVVLGLSMFLIPAIMQLNIAGWAPAVLIGLLTFILAAMTGIQYKLATALRSGQIGQIASSTYGADLAGSAFGIFMIGVFVFPVLGIMNAVIILASINLLAAIVLYLKKDPRYA